jgi:hypothetical protein
MTAQGRKFGVRNWGWGVRSLPVWALLLVVLLASAALWGPGIVNTRGGGDSPFLLQRLQQMVVNLRAGVFPVRWMPDAAYGLGYPFFNHYSALPFYVAAGFNLLGLDLLTALKLTQTLGFLLAALAMFGWVNHMWRSRAVAWLAAVAYTVAPFHLVNVYVRGDSLSEFYAFVFYPLILWAVERVVHTRSRMDADSEDRKAWMLDRTELLNVVYLALAYAGLVMAHNISAFIFSPFAVLYLILLVARANLGRSRRLRALVLGLVGLLFGAALAAWTWLPALLERGYVQSENLTGGYFDYIRHFRSANLVQSDLLFDYSIQVSIGGPSPFAMGGPQALLAAVGLLLLLRFAVDKRRRTKDKGRGTDGEASRTGRLSSVLFVVGGLLLATLMITPLSRLLWDHLPLLPMVQFPWRFLSVQALFAAVAAAALVLLCRGWRAWGVAVAAAVLLVASTLFPLQPEHLSIGPQDVTTTRLQEYELFTGNIGTTIRWEWLPQAAVPRPFTFDTVIDPQAVPQAIPLEGALIEATQTERRPTERVWRVRTSDEGATLALPLLYWPGWHAWVDGEGASVRAVDGSGYLALQVPPGEHTVRLKLGRTPLRAAAETLSLLTLLLLSVFALWHIRWSRSRAADYGLRMAYGVWRIAPYVALLLIGVLVLAVRSSPPAKRSDDLTMDFVAMPYLHHNPEGVPFADMAGGPREERVRLSGYSFSSDNLGPGDTLVVTLEWDGDPQTTGDGWVTMRLVSPAEHLSDLGSGPYALAEDTVQLTETTVLRLTVPPGTSRGVYLLQLRVGGADGEWFARTPKGEGQGALYLRPVRVTEGAPVAPDAPLLALVGPDIRLHATELERTSLASGSPALTIRLDWSTVHRMAANYKVSVRLLDPADNLRASTDTQPGYGFTPTSLWRPGKVVADRYNLALPADLLPGGGYRLLFLFYYAASGTEVARVELGPFTLPLESPFVFEPHPRLFELPPLSHALDVDFGGQVRLAGYDLVVERDALDLTLWWVTLRQPEANYTVFVHLFDPSTEKIVVQHDAMPRQGGYPTSGWLPGEVISDTLRLSLRDVAPGEYRLAVGLYDVTTGDRLAVTGPAGAPFPDQRLILPDVVQVAGE